MSRKTANAVMAARIALAAGALWGLGEALLGWGCRAAGRPAASGSLLAGTAFFFLAGGHALGLPRAALPGVAAVCAAVKLAAIRLAAGSGAPAWSFASGPVTAYFLQALLWAALAPPATGEERLPAAATRGFAAGALASLLFPVAGLLTGLAPCRHPGSGLHLSVHYAALTAVTAALAVPLGARLAARVRETPVLRRARDGRAFVFEGLAAAAFALTIALARFAG